jgi:hypothetical protein
MLVRSLAAWACCFALAAPSWGQTRLALLIGNEDYPASVGRLSKPHEDVATIQAALEDVHFQVEAVHDADRQQMIRSLQAFAARLSAASRAAGGDVVGFFYYAGHGASTTVGQKRRNFLLPARATITSGPDLVALGERLDEVVDILATAHPRALIVVADACRNTLQWSQDRGEGGRGFGTEAAASGVLVAQSTAEDETAPDDGVFARALADQIRVPGQEVELAFINAYRHVARSRSQYRVPTIQGALTDPLCLAGCGPAATASAAAPAQTPPPGGPAASFPAAPVTQRPAADSGRPGGLHFLCDAQGTQKLPGWSVTAQVTLEVENASSGRFSCTAVPPVCPGGWRKMDHIAITDREITAVVNIDPFSHPTLRVDRVTGAFSFIGWNGEFHGQCRVNAP